MTEKTMTDEDFDLAVGSVTSFYQSKRAQVKKQLTHWIGKFAIVKAENNVLRKKNKELSQCLTDARIRFNTAAGNAMREWDKKDTEVRSLKLQVQELEAGALV